MGREREKDKKKERDADRKVMVLSDIFFLLRSAPFFSSTFPCLLFPFHCTGIAHSAINNYRLGKSETLTGHFILFGEKK